MYLYIYICVYGGVCVYGCVYVCIWKYKCACGYVCGVNANPINPRGGAASACSARVKG